MSKKNDKVYYAVGCGREVGIYNTWKECKVQVDGIADAKFRKFFSYDDAEEFVNFWKKQNSEKSDNADGRVSKRHGPGNRPGRKNSVDASLKGPAKENKLIKSKKINFILGGHSKNLDKTVVNEPKSFLGSYVSPINHTSLLSELDYSKKVIKNDIKTVEEPPDGFSVSQCGFKVEAMDDVCVENAINHNNCKLNNENSMPSVSCNKVKHDHVSTVEADDTDSVTHEPVRPCTPQMHNSSSNAQTAKLTSNEKNVLEVLSQVETNQMATPATCNSTGFTSSEPHSNVSGSTVHQCLNLFSSVIKLLMRENTNNGRLIVDTLRLFIQQLTPTDTNGSVNPQINAVEGNGAVEARRYSPETSPCQHGDHLLPCTLLTSSNPPQSPSTFAANDCHRNIDVDVVALNLRLNSFEKRFDDCLKEVGSILSEITHIRSEIKEIKESMSGKGTSPRNSPQKKSSLLQTTLAFGGSKCDGESSFSGFQSLPSSRFYSKTVDSDSQEPSTKKGVTLKRKLSQNNEETDPKKILLENANGQFDITKVKMETVDYTSFTVDDENFVHVYTDGACQSNGKKGAKAGIGIWFGDNHPLNIAEPVDGPQTNNSAEIQAARVAIDLAAKVGLKKLKIFTDSEFLINCATKWIRRWKKNDWTLVDGGKVKNRVELEKLDWSASKINVRWEKVEGHAGIKGNEMADKLANEGAAKSRR